MALKRFICLLAGMALLLPSAVAWSAEVHGSSSTQYQWFNDYLTGNKQAEFGEYLNLTVSKIDDAGKLTISGYGRLTQDIRNGDGLNGRLYYLYADYHDLFDKVDIRLGRQFVNYAAGSALVDGGKIELKNVGPIGFSVMGGRNVIFDMDDEATTRHDWIWGASAYLNGFKNLDAEVSYLMKYDQDGVARKQIGASFDEYLFDIVKVYANTRYDIREDVFSEIQGGVKIYPFANLVLTGEWYSNHPTFDKSSVYSLFSVDRYQEAVFRADYTLNDMFSINGGYTRQIYKSGDDVDVYEIGTTIRPIKQVALDLSYDYQLGDGEKLNGGAVDITVTPTKQIEVAGGVHYDTYEYNRASGRETARQYWFGGKYKFTDKISLSARAEDNVNQQYSNDWTGRVAFKYDF